MFLAFQLLEIVQDQGAAVVKGTGKQNIGVFFTTVAYFVFAIPICYYSAFKMDMGLVGIQLGSVVANIFLVICYNILIC